MHRANVHRANVHHANVHHANAHHANTHHASRTTPARCHKPAATSPLPQARCHKLAATPLPPGLSDRLPRLGQHPRHDDVRDAGFHELLAFHLEPVGLVEALGVGLRVQHQHAVAIAMALADQGV